MHSQSLSSIRPGKSEQITTAKKKLEHWSTIPKTELLPRHHTSSGSQGRSGHPMSGCFCTPLAKINVSTPANLASDKSIISTSKVFYIHRKQHLQNSILNTPQAPSLKTKPHHPHRPPRPVPFAPFSPNTAIAVHGTDPAGKQSTQKRSWDFPTCGSPKNRKTHFLNFLCERNATTLTSSWWLKAI